MTNERKICEFKTLHHEVKDDADFLVESYTEYKWVLIEPQPHYLEITKEQWQDMVDCIIHGVNGAITRWYDEKRINSFDEGRERVMFIIDFMHSDWWVD